MTHTNKSQKSRVLALLKSAGSRGVRSTEFLSEHLPRFSARIYELRNEGHLIRSRPDPQSASGMVYVYHGLVGVGSMALRPKAKREASIETRLLALMERFDGRIAVVCRKAPSAPVTRWTISVAHENRLPSPEEIWIGETLEEALSSAERSPQ